MIPAAWICLFAPLAGALAITLAGDRLSRRGAGLLSTASVAVSFAAALVSFFALLGRDEEERQVGSTAWTWLSSAGTDFGLRIVVDPLSVLMMLIVSGVGALIVGYALGYMHGEKEERRFFAYMALFVFSMLLLVEAGNLLILLSGWGLVGLSSYLLIGFNQERPSAIAAAKKAFIMNAFGDAAMVLAFFLLVLHTGTLDFPLVFERAEDSLRGNDWVVNLVALGLLGGAVAKSAQIPLHTWLPDAMEGPTPVSALIHAATMVTAGVYLLVRAAPLFELAPGVQDLAAGLGAAPLVFAGLVALVQTDIKRVIAYSTMSQIGYMFMGAALGSYGNGMFHLMTHAFFKALLFLAAGLVIHAIAGQQDMRRMGGLRRLMPRTWIAFLVGGLALVGIPPFSGFFSKDAILASALERGLYGQILFALGLFGAFLTGLYTFRMIFIVFGGEPSSFVREHLHVERGREGPLSMAIPVAVLSVLAVIGGLVQIPGAWHPFSDFLDTVAEPLIEPTLTQDVVTSIAAVALGLLGMGIALRIYGRGYAQVRSFPAFRGLLEHKFFFDDIYDALFYYPAVGVTAMLQRLVEVPLIGGSLAGVGLGTRRLSAGTRDLQTGLVRNYVLALAGGLAILAFVFVAVR